MLEIGPGNICFRKVTLATRSRDPCLLRLRLEGALQAASLHPPGLPDAAILCIRRLKGPPGMTLRLDEARLPAAWSKAMVASLEDLARRANRPARGDVQANAPAVLFADRAELLACLGRDWAENRLAERWWWRRLLFQPPAAETVVSCWVESPEYVPGALEILARWDLACRFARLVEPPAAHCLLDSMARSFGLGNLQATLDHRTVPEPEEEIPFEPPSGARKAFAPTAGKASTQRITAGLPPWHDFAPESIGADLHPAQQLLLGVGLGLRRAPRTVRSTEFAEAVGEFVRDSIFDRAGSPLGHAALPEPGMPAGNGLPPVGIPGSAVRDPVRMRPVSTVALPDREPKAQGLDLAGAEPCAPPLQVPADGADHVRRAGSRSPARTISREGESPIVEAVGEAVRGEKLPSLQQPSPAPTTAPFQPMPLPVKPLDGELVETGLGGLFYLVNLALCLGLYADFTAPLQSGISLSPWDFIALVGKRLLGGRGGEDPIWEMLDHLAGRAPGQPAGQDFDPPDEWRLPPAWLDSLPEGPWKWFSSHGLLIVRHPAGFSVLEVPVEAGCPDPARQLQQELLPYRPCRVRHIRGHARRVSVGVHLRLDPWLDRLVEYVGARLCRALGLENIAAIPECLCLRPARVRLTSTRLDITFNLAEHPLAIRLAGLDRDPGWVPAGGRYVVFHYE